MLPTPTKFTLVAGAAEAGTTLNAFDKALLIAGIGNLNLLRVSSILPPGAVYVDKLDIPAGSLLPTAYGTISSQTPGERIAAAVGVGFTRDSYGVIMEFSGKCTKQEAEERVQAMVEEAFAARQLELADVRVKAIDHVVEKVGCVLAAVPLWY